ncbi:hypothetical protein B0H12DRAFT_1149751 [Mycena haematopus]|nr:hypothetical protein B0H12DRAFT_1149751 [Mycena haematopus]
MVSISDLPQELVDKIVSEFKGDEDNLRTCALISPSFVPSTPAPFRLGTPLGT